jgi:retron-type reverse transcriptase
MSILTTLSNLFVINEEYAAGFSNPIIKTKMAIEQEHIQAVKAAFENMQSRSDFLKLLNDVKPLVYGTEVVPFELKQLSFYANPNLAGKRYTDFPIRKKSGGTRIIHAPVSGLKSIQKVLSFILQCVFEPHEAAMGFVMGRSIVDNARIHQGCNYVYNIDLKDFFPSINQARVWACLKLEPFNLKGSAASDTPEDRDMSFLLVGQKPVQARQQIANMIAAICCTEMTVERQDENGVWLKVQENVLPQGAPTSPIVTNIVCQRLDRRLTGLANRFGLRYSRYADDITFSSRHNVYQKDGELLKELHRIIKDQGFNINEKKTRLQKTGYRQEVTGLVVNEKVNVRKRYIKQLRQWLCYWERYGYEKAQTIFNEQYYDDKGYLLAGGLPSMRNVLRGKLEYIRMVKGQENTTYNQLRQRFEKLTADVQTDNPVSQSREKELENILNTLFDNGFDAAMEKYSMN